MTTLSDNEIILLQQQADKYKQRLVYNNKYVTAYNNKQKELNLDAYNKKKSAQVLENYYNHKDEYSIKRKALYKLKKEQKAEEAAKQLVVIQQELIN